VSDLVSVYVTRTEAEAISLCMLLQSAGIEAIHRITNLGAGAFDGWSAGGPREILVRPEDAEVAREVLAPESA
jgi:hypothetical protein